MLRPPIYSPFTLDEKKTNLYIYNIFNSTLEGTGTKRSPSNRRQRLIFSCVYLLSVNINNNNNVKQKKRTVPFPKYLFATIWLDGFNRFISCNLGYFVFYLIIIYCGCKEQCWVTLFLFLSFFFFCFNYRLKKKPMLKTPPTLKVSIEPRQVLR